MKILLSGSNGFIGKHLRLRLNEFHEVISYTKTDTDLESKIKDADFIIHLAGVNRPSNDELFNTVNVGLTKEIIRLLKKNNKNLPIIFSSSTQAVLDNPYGSTKKKAEDILKAYHDFTRAPVSIYRLPGVFGKWSKPFYNTVVATFCHLIHLDQPLEIHDPNKVLELVYIDNVIDSMMSEVNTLEGFKVHEIDPIYKISLQDLANTLRAFHELNKKLKIPDLDDPFIKKLYSTYMSFKPLDKLVTPLIKHADERGSFTELLKQSNFGQVSVNITAPGISKGDHYHHHKHEKFIVVKGEGIISLRNVFSDDIIKYKVSGEEMSSVDIPPGYTHTIENTGPNDLVTVMWINELFDPQTSDTYPLKVKK